MAMSKRSAGDQKDYKLVRASRTNHELDQALEKEQGTRVLFSDYEESDVAFNAIVVCGLPGVVYGESIGIAGIRQFERNESNENDSRSNVSNSARELGGIIWQDTARLSDSIVSSSSGIQPPSHAIYTVMNQQNRPASNQAVTHSNNQQSHSRVERILLIKIMESSDQSAHIINVSYYTKLRHFSQAKSFYFFVNNNESYERTLQTSSVIIFKSEFKDVQRAIRDNASRFSMLSFFIPPVPSARASHAVVIEEISNDQLALATIEDGAMRNNTNIDSVKGDAKDGSFCDLDSTDRRPALESVATLATMPSTVPASAVATTMYSAAKTTEHAAAVSLATRAAPVTPVVRWDSKCALM